MPTSLVPAPFTVGSAPVDSAILQVSFAAILCSLNFTLLIYAFPALAVPNQAQGNANFTSTSTLHCRLRSS